ncbi:MAG: hypothetical protein ACYTHK_07175 [Planctomycetota bacterium]
MLRLLPLLLLAACASTPVPQPSASEASVLVVHVNITGTRMTGAPAYPRRVMFVKLEGEALDGDARPVWSNYARGSRAYLFNAEPGRYVVACAVPLVDGKDHYVFLPENVVRASVIEVKPGEVVWMGTATATEDTIWSKADELQQRFRGFAMRERKKPNVWTTFFPRLVDYRGIYGRFSRDDVEKTEAQIRKTVRRWGWDR